MDKEQLIYDIINRLKDINNLKLLENLRHYLAEYTQNKTYFNEFNLWSILLAKIELEKHHIQYEEQKRRNRDKIEFLEILNNNKELKDKIISLNDTDSELIKDILRVIK